VKVRTAFLIFLGFIVASLLLLIIYFQLSGGISENSQPELGATVKFSNTQVLIANTDSFDWTNVTMKINDKYTLP
jgi:hypothetical protein